MKYYAFLWQRPIDTKPWPSIYEDKELAEKAPFRISAVIEVELEKERVISPTDPIGLGPV